jgi:Carboxypeptidase regulatory-like domain
MTVRAKVGPVLLSLIFLSLLFATCMLATAQSPAQPPQIRGAVHDPTGAAVSGAEVTVTSGSERRTTTTGQDGSFSLPADGMTSATVEVQAPGFSMASQAWSQGQGEVAVLLLFALLRHPPPLPFRSLASATALL